MSASENVKRKMKQRNVFIFWHKLASLVWGQEKLVLPSCDLTISGTSGYPGGVSSPKSQHPDASGEQFVDGDPLSPRWILSENQFSTYKQISKWI